MALKIEIAVNNTPDEKTLINRAKKDPKVFGEVYDRYYPQIFGYILKRTANLEVAQDVTSETFFKALKKLWQFKWQNVPFSSWLYRIANNEIVNHFRKNKRKTISLEKIPEPCSGSNISEEIFEAEKEMENHQAFLFIKKKILQLPFEYQEVIALRFFERKKIQEICEILKKKEGTVKSILSRALDRLREDI